MSDAERPFRIDVWSSFHYTFVANSHVPETSRLSSIHELLSSSKTSAEIQEQIMETIGYEGDGFEIASDLLQDAHRSTLAALLERDLLRPTESDTSNGQGIGSNQRVARENLFRMENLNTPTYTGIEAEMAGYRGNTVGIADSLPLNAQVYSAEQANARIQAQLEEAANRPLFSGTGVSVQSCVKKHACANFI